MLPPYSVPVPIAMGVDLLDLRFRVEMVFGVRPTDDAFLKYDADGKIRGPTVGEVLESILVELRANSKLEPEIPLRTGGRHQDEGHDPVSQDRRTEEDVWQAMQQIIVDVLGVNAEEVTRDARLVEDLGAE